MARFGAFFKYARRRHQIYLDRAAGKPRPWTRDPILSTYRFTNVFRELDKTTVWFRENVRDPLRDEPEVLLATVVFRMLNRIEVGEAVFCQRDMIDHNRTAFEEFVKDGNVKHLKRAIKTTVPRGPYVTGAYIISTPPGLAKLDGALSVIGGFADYDWDRALLSPTTWKSLAKYMQRDQWTLRQAFNALSEVPYFGSFHSYEIVTDLRHTNLLRAASDVNTWANVGPGAARGLNRIYGREMSDGGKRVGKVSVQQMLEEMQEILRASRDAVHWPQHGKSTRKLAQNVSQWPKWELRDVEHTLCEFDKYERVRLGQGRPRGVYR